MLLAKSLSSVRKQKHSKWNDGGGPEAKPKVTNTAFYICSYYIYYVQVTDPKSSRWDVNAEETLLP